jgi:hypothetical protein
MSTDRGRRRTVKSTKQRRTPTLSRGIRLAPGVRVDGSGDALSVLIWEDHKVQLNPAALAVLKLCDGSRDRDGIVFELTRDSQRQALAGEIVEFLEAAFARGWIVDA